MKYIDLHTHTLPAVRDPEETILYNVIIGRNPFPPDESGMLFTCGIHPWYIRTDALEEQYALFRKEAVRKNVVMIGEAGLDKDVSVPLSVQTEVFEEQIDYAERLGKPLLIHCVKAWDELVALRKKWAPSQPWILHGFRKKGEQAAQLRKQGFYFSFGKYFQETAVREAWPGRLLVETDESGCPIEEIYQRIASVLQIPVAELAGQIEETVAGLGFLSRHAERK